MAACSQSHANVRPCVGLADGGPRSAGWREHGASGDARRKKFDFDFREPLEGGRRRASGDGPDEDRDGLPEWCTDEEEGEMGTFDSSGAFLPIKVSGPFFRLLHWGLPLGAALRFLSTFVPLSHLKSPKELIPEEQDLEKEDGGGESERERDVQREQKDSREETSERAIAGKLLGCGSEEHQNRDVLSPMPAETTKAGAGNEEEEGQPMTSAPAFQPSADPVEPQTPHSPPTSASLKLNEGV